MAFKEKQNFIGETTKKLGENVAIYGKYIITSGLSDTTVVYYERDNDGNWSKIKQTNYYKTTCR